MRTCSGRTPMPTNRAGMRRRNGNILNRRKIKGARAGPSEPSTRSITRFCTVVCMSWMAFIGKVRRFCTRSRWSLVNCPRRSGSARILAAAIASCTARLTPTPPIGDIACAASPIHNNPGRHQRVSRSTATVSRLISFQSFSSPTGSR